MTATVDSVRIVVTGDSDADTSWLEQEGYEDRLRQLNEGQFGFCGVFLEARINVPNAQGGVWYVTTVTTPGLWGIEDDSGAEYLVDVARDEYWTLKEMLEQLNVPTPVLVDETLTYR